jgi:8-oxo-dGTP pyrophosphatase MutT (NUDIX family)
MKRKGTEAVLCSTLAPVSQVHTNNWFSVYNRGSYLTVEPHETEVAVLVVVDVSSVVLVKARRPVIADCTWELPAGGCLPKESPEQGAVRELKEEVGINVAVERLVEIESVCSNPNRSPRLPFILRVDISRDEYENRAQQDDEIEAVEVFTLTEIRKMILVGDIYVGLPGLVLSRLILSENDKS